MTDNEIFYRFSPFIQDFIYNNGWQDLRAVQLAAARVIFESDKNLLITSSTASGKTEAAFFPILSLMCEDMPQSVGALYIAPLKSLINDQFSRLDELLDLTGIPVFHWHGDVAQSHKAKLLKEPQGILQITPESLESMLMNRSNDLVRLFGDLRFIVIDEIHTLTGTDRGNQIICQLVRLARIIGHTPRRIGLSATIGDAKQAADWLGGGTDIETVVPEINEGKTKWRLGMEHFFIQGEDFDQSHDFAHMGESMEEQPDTSHGKIELDPGYEYIYDCVKNKKAIVFSNSREETEYVTATLRKIADNRKDPDNCLIHHGNLSASIREVAVSKMKSDEQKCVVCATVTMELGIDIGRLERIIQNDAPNSV
ncbi:MAG: DEAD/DEAH box helicase, partial [Clostridia bacterium]|nr:DEAD/DEAH box helicase [Clostridia bacterium]